MDLDPGFFEMPISLLETNTRELNGSFRLGRAGLQLGVGQNRFLKQFLTINYGLWILIRLVEEFF